MRARNADRKNPHRTETNGKETDKHTNVDGHGGTVNPGYKGRKN